MAPSGQGQFRVSGRVLLPPDQAVDRLADHPGNGYIMLAGKSTELLVVPIVQAD
jgi:hypothetical protein